MLPGHASFDKNGLRRTITEMKTESLELSHDTFSRNTRLQLRQLLDAVRELTTPPDPPKRPIGFVTHEDKKDTPKGASAGRGKKVT